MCRLSTVYACRDDGVGLAAPQVGINIRLMVFNEAGERGKGEEMVLANPRIIKTGKRTTVEQEACLSFKTKTETVLGDVEVRLQPNCQSIVLGYGRIYLVRLALTYQVNAWLWPTERRLTERHSYAIQESRCLGCPFCCQLQVSEIIERDMTTYSINLQRRVWGPAAQSPSTDRTQGAD